LLLISVAAIYTARALVALSLVNGDLHSLVKRRELTLVTALRLALGPRQFTALPGTVLSQLVISRTAPESASGTSSLIRTLGFGYPYDGAMLGRQLA